MVSNGPPPIDFRFNLGSHFPIGKCGLDDLKTVLRVWNPMTFLVSDDFSRLNVALRR